MFDFAFFLQSTLLGLGLTMDAFSISLANGLSEPLMKKRKTFSIAGVFAIFQFLMPLIGWICVHTVVQYFAVIEKAIPWIAFIVLSFIGGKMIFDAFKEKEEECGVCVKFGALIVQGIATSIDALSVGFTIAEYDVFRAIICALIIGVITFAICLVGIIIGKKFGTYLSNKATVFGGIILILIGIRILLTSLLG